MYHLYNNPSTLSGYRIRICVPKIAYQFCDDEGRRIPPLEQIFIDNPFASYKYARDIMKGRWLEAEPIIIKYPRYAYYYSRHVIKGRWPEAEPFIITNKTWWRVYCERFQIT